MNLVFDTSGYYFNAGDYDLSIYYYIPITEDSKKEDIDRQMNDKIKELLSLGEIKEYSVMKGTLFFTTDESIWSKEYLKYNGYDISMENDLPIQVQSVGKEEYERQAGPGRQIRRQNQRQNRRRNNGRQSSPGKSFREVR